MEMETATMIPSGTMNPSSGGTLDSSASGTMMPTEGVSSTTTNDNGEAVIVESANTGEGIQCGVNFCEAPLECCEPTCGTCVEPGSICRPRACVGPAKPQDDGDTDTDVDVTVSTNKAGELFD